MFWNILLIALFSGCINSLEMDFATVVQDGDVISPRLNVLETKYLKLEDQTWRMDARAGFWALVFEYMELEESQHCEHDYIQIKEITNSTSAPMVMLCGNQVPEPYISESPHVTVRFVSDLLFEYRGFKITVFHAARKDLLLPKIRKQPKQEAFTLAPDAHYGEKYEDKDSTFYFLVGSVGLALILFGILLLYFATLLRRRSKGQRREPGVYYNSSSTLESSEASTRSVSVSSSTLPHASILKSGKRYSRRMNEKSAPATKGQVVLLRCESLPVKTQHNMLYPGQVL